MATLEDSVEGFVDIPMNEPSSPHKKRKMYVENNIIVGLDSSRNDDDIAKDVNELTIALSSKSVIKSKFVLIYNIDPVIEHCDLIDLCKDVSFPIAVNYFRGSFGRAWLKFQNHQIAMKIVDKLNKFELEDRKLIVGLIENKAKYVDTQQAMKEYNIWNNKLYGKREAKTPNPVNALEAEKAKSKKEAAQSKKKKKAIKEYNKMRKKAKKKKVSNNKRENIQKPKKIKAEAKIAEMLFKKPKDKSMKKKAVTAT